MGSCVSIHRDPESAMKLRLSVGSKNEKLLIPSPIKDKSDKVNGRDFVVADVAVKSQWSPPRFRDAGSKEEAFFDSQPWLESDCEDDFLSVNGDFTPSRGSTPVHHKFSSPNPPLNEVFDMEQTFGSANQPSPPDKKKRLSELFKESLSNNQYEDEKNAASNEDTFPEKVKSEAVNVVQPKSANRNGCFSGANSGSSSERTPNGVLGKEDESVKAAQCCLPSLHSNRSFRGRKTKMSPSGGIG